SYDDGRGEAADARAVRDWANSVGNSPARLLAGFSFGAAVALRLADAQPAQSLITVGFPAEYFDTHIPRPDTRWLALFGDDDDVIDVASAIARTQALKPAPQVDVMAGAGHFLHGRIGELRRRARTFLEWP